MMENNEHGYRKLDQYTGKKITIILIAINAAVFAVLEIMGDTTDGVFMAQHGAMFAPYCIQEGKWYLLFTSMFLHFGFPHLLNNMFILFCIGEYLERFLGKVKYLILYLAAGLTGNLLSLAVEVRTGDFAVSAGASGAIFGVVGGMLWVVLRNKGKVANLSVRGMLIMLALSLYFGFTSSGVDNWAHIGGAAGGFIFAMFLYRRKSTLL